MASKISRRKWGKSRIEIENVKEDILDLIRKEYPKIHIYRIFHKNGKFSMSYYQFCRIIKEIEISQSGREHE